MEKIIILGIVFLSMALLIARCVRGFKDGGSCAGCAGGHRCDKKEGCRSV